MASAAEQERQLFQQVHADLSNAQTDAERERVIAAADKKYPGLRELLEVMGGLLLGAHHRISNAQRVIDLLDDEDVGRDDFAQLPPMDGLTQLALCAMLDESHLMRAKRVSRTKGGKRSAQVRAAEALVKGQKARKHAEHLLREGEPVRGLAVKVAEMMNVTPTTVRAYLKQFPPRTKRN